MPYHIEIRKDMDCMIATFSEDFDMQREYSGFMRDRYNALEQANRPLYYVGVAHQVSMSLEDIIRSANSLTHGQYAIAKHRNFKGLLMITHDPSLTLAAKGLSSDAFGNINVHIFENLDDAVDFVRSQR